MANDSDTVDDDTARATALGNTILRGVIGSTAYGTALDSQADRDEMGVFMEPPALVCGLRRCDTYTQRDQPQGARSQPGDLDLVMHSLRRYCQLAVKGNFSTLQLLYLPSYITVTPIGAALVAMRESFITRKAGAQFFGYLNGQKHKLTGERAKNVNRPELVEKYGYDTKFAMHALRVGLQGIEAMTRRRITLPVPEPELSTLRAVRTGQVSFAEAIALIEDAEKRLDGLVSACTWQVDRRAVDAFLTRAHLDWWQSRGLVPQGSTAPS